MDNYIELVKRLREQVKCNKKLYPQGAPFETLLLDLSADAIEELQRCLDGVCSDNEVLCKRIDELSRICAYHPWPEPQIKAEEGE